jgi:peptidyl-prolyl cis-trans isomerase B (cyclophilin B)
MNKTFLLVLACFSLMITGCAQNDYVVTIKTKYGDMVAILYDETPKHKENFIKLASEGYYDSLLFHRVIQGFMIQGGDPDSRKASAGQPLGNGGPGYTIPPEFNAKLFHERGALAAARLGDAMNPKKESSGSQFYIVQGRLHTREQLLIDQQKYGQALQRFFQNADNKVYFDSVNAFFQARDEQGYNAFMQRLRPVVEEQLGISVEREVDPRAVEVYTTVGGTPQLDGEYTVFGKVIAGLEVIDEIASQPRGPADRPVEDVRMTVVVEKMSRKAIEKKYGYQYPN